MNKQKSHIHIYQDMQCVGFKREKNRTYIYPGDDMYSSKILMISKINIKMKKK